MKNLNAPAAFLAICIIFAVLYIIRLLIKVWAKDDRSGTITDDCLEVNDDFFVFIDRDNPDYPIGIETNHDDVFMTPEEFVKMQKFLEDRRII